MRHDCHVCRAEGFGPHARVLVRTGERSVIATLNVITGDLLQPGEMALSEPAWRLLGVDDGTPLAITHPEPLESLGHVRAKLYGRRLDAGALHAVVADVVGGRYPDVAIAAFLTACAGDRMDRDEITGLTRAMLDAGGRIDWGRTPIVDKHCVGGLPGNRTTLVVVPIVAACGLTIPKTSSRAITSPAGSADTMEALAPVRHDLAAMRRIVEREGGCIVWGGAVGLSPADDLFVRVERALDLDSEGQLVASVLSKKAAAGSTHVVVDMPVGPTAKVRTRAAARALIAHFEAVGHAVGLAVRVVLSDGMQPVGRGIGPALEARDVLAVLQGTPDAPVDLRERSVALAAHVLELAGAVGSGQGAALARAALDDGRAWRKFQAICEAQGGLRVPPVAPHTLDVGAPVGGVVHAIDNRRLARIAKLAGAPRAAAAGVALRAPLGTEVAAGQPLFTIHAESPGELHYASAYAAAHLDIVRIEVPG